MSAHLGHDGTMDTVIVCDDCGHESRYNYDSSMRDEQDNADRIAELAKLYPADNIMRLQEHVNEQYYNEWMDWCIEDFESEHECPRYSIHTWFERDRAHVALYYGNLGAPIDAGEADDVCIVEWWDSEVTEAIEDGFLDPKDYKGSAIAYAESLELTLKGRLT